MFHQVLPYRPNRLQAILAAGLALGLLAAFLWR